MVSTAIPASPDRSDGERRAMIASGFGWGLDSFDFYLYVYGLPAILTAFGLTKAAGGLLATCTLVASAVGGIAMGAFSDRIGRKRALMFSIATTARFVAPSSVSTAASAVLPDIAPRWLPENRPRSA